MQGFGKAWRRGVAVAVLAAFVPLASSCFGTFQLTRKVYEFNRTVSPDKWIRWFCFLAMNFIPIYWFATVVDVLFANSLEFWTGKNPITAENGRVRSVVGEHGEMARATFRDDGSVLVEVQEPSGELHSLVMEPSGDELVARDLEGHELGRLTGLAGQPMLVRAPAPAL